jgi:hypothetical protein
MDYFYPDFTQGQGYFSIDSYPINDTSPTTSQLKTSQIPIYKSTVSGNEFDLRNCLDFRPVKTRTATATTVVATAQTNNSPSSSSNFYADANGLRLAAPGQQLQYDYSYYLPRRDVVAVDKNGNFFIIKGIPATNPSTPITPDNTMTLSSLYISPYPSLSPSYATSLKRLDLGCSVKKLATQRLTMRDLQAMKQRIENLEYYVALSLLEKAAINLKIPNAVTGLDRFKNGIFVDTFADHSLGATYSSEYKITVDPDEKSIRPTYEMFSIPYRSVSNTDCNIVGDYVVLPYTEEAFFTQNVATTNKNMETQVYRYRGTMEIASSMTGTDNDFWVETTLPPDGLSSKDVVLTSNNYDGGPLTTTWNGWQRSITGYDIYQSDGVTKIGSFGAGTDWGTISSQAQAFAEQLGSVQVETLTAYNRTGTEMYLKEVTASVDLGDRVVDTKYINYIRPQTLKIHASGLKANTRFYTFFDNTEMSTYTRPLTSTGLYAGAAGSAVTSNYNNELWCELQLPATGKRFLCGTKNIILTDSITNASDATSSASGYFAAQGLIQQKQDTILTTRTTIRAAKEVSGGFNSSDPRQAFNATPAQIAESTNSCMAYSFLVEAPFGEEGLFLSSVDLFLASKSDTLGFWVELREIDAGGQITRTSIPMSKVVFANTAQIITSTDSSLPMNVKFQVPLFLYSGQQYAIVVHPMGQNPDMYFWVAELGYNNVLGGAQYSARPGTGTLYRTNNNLNWNMVDFTDMKIKMYRAKFDTTKTGTLIIGNNPVDFFRLSNVSSALDYYGETFQSTDNFTLSSSGGVVQNTFILRGRTSGANGSVLSNVSGRYVISNTGYTAGETANVFSSAMVDQNFTAVIGTIEPRASGTVLNYKVNGSNTTLMLMGSNGKFSIGNSGIGLVTKRTSKIAAIDNLTYSTVDFEPTILLFNKTALLFEMQAGSGNFAKIHSNRNYTFDSEQTLYSASAVGSGPTNNVRITLTSSSANGYLSPVIDLARLHSVYVRNIINSNTYNENTVNGGSLYNKYISKVVTLAEDQDAEDIKVVLTAYRPPTSNIKVWIKIVSNEDPEEIKQKPWVELGYDDYSKFSSVADTNDFLEYTFSFPKAPADRVTLSAYSGPTINIGDVIVSNANSAPGGTISSVVTAVEGGSTNTIITLSPLTGNGFYANARSGGWANIRYSDGTTIKGNANIAFVGSTPATVGIVNSVPNIIRYRTDMGVEYTTYKQFIIKIGLSATNSAIVPKVADLRAIAIQV